MNQSQTAVIYKNLQQRLAKKNPENLKVYTTRGLIIHFQLPDGKKHNDIITLDCSTLTAPEAHRFVQGILYTLEPTPKVIIDLSKVDAEQWKGEFERAVQSSEPQPLLTREEVEAQVRAQIDAGQIELPLDEASWGYDMATRVQPTVQPSNSEKKDELQTPSGEAEDIPF